MQRKMKKLISIVLSLFLLISCFAVSPIKAYAASVDLGGVLETTNTFCKPDLSQFNSTLLVSDFTGCTLATEEYSYFTRNLVPDTTGSYTIAVSSANLSPTATGYGYGIVENAKDDTVIYLYDTTFAPGSPLANLLYANDNIRVFVVGYSFGNDFKSCLKDITLTANHTYVLVVASCKPDATGTINFNAAGDGTINFYPNQYSSDVDDITPPTLIAGTANRTSDIEGTVKFASDEAGEYYYAIVNQGADVPDIDTLVAGTACTSDENTISNPTGLTEGAKDIYIKVKDAAGNVSNTLMLNIPAFVPPDATAPMLTAGEVNRTSDTTGTVKFTSDEAGEYYYAIVNQGADVPDIDTTVAGTACISGENTISNPTGLTEGAKDIHIKVKDAAGNVSNALMLNIPAFAAPDTTAPILTAGEVNRTSHTTGTVKFTSDEAGQYYYSVVSDGAAAPTINTSGAGIACTTTETTIIDPTGLNAGAKDIYIKVKDAAGNVSNVLKIDLAAYTEPSSGGSGGSSIPSTPAKQDTVAIIVNGKTENAGTETKSTEAGKTTVTVEVNSATISSKIEEAIKKNPSGRDNLVQIPVTDKTAELVKVELTGDIVKRLETNTFDVSIKRDAVEYVLPAQELTISKVAKELGVTEQALKDINIEIQITKLDATVTDKYNEVAKANGAELIFPPVAFEIVAKTTKADGTTAEVDINKFSNYVERVMEIRAEVDPSKITTGIVFNQDGTYSHVPTEVFQKDTKLYAKLNSLTNSNYSVIWNAVTVKSVENHWSKNAVNNLASRLVIFNPEAFVPNKAITRADFAEYIVRALGLYREGLKHENRFKDVSANGDRTLAITIASEYGIVTGYPDGTFRPESLITREEAMTMYQKAMTVTKLVGTELNRYQAYTDYKQVSGWAAAYVQEVLSAHVFNGNTSTTISPKSNLTYAEAVQAIKNLLVESKLINN